MNALVSKVQTALALGIPNLVRVFSYRLGVKLGINPVQRIQAQLPNTKDFFAPFTYCGGKVGDGGEKTLKYFGWHTTQHDSPPDWHKNPFNDTTARNSHRPWWQIPDFDPDLGDIKTVWEASRFDWVLHFAQQSIQGDQYAIEKLNHWISDWCEHNPTYYGPNWKCGQEASIRVMHLAMAALLLQQHQQPSESLQNLLKAHLLRIAPHHPICHCPR